MEKPIILIEREMKEEFVEVLNKYISKIPATMIANCLKDLTTQVDNIATQQYENALKQYNESEVEEDG